MKTTRISVMLTDNSEYNSDLLPLEITFLGPPLEQEVARISSFISIPQFSLL
jgi:hypothetical protein